jgi:hypothetical protein
MNPKIPSSPRNEPLSPIALVRLVTVLSVILTIGIGSKLFTFPPPDAREVIVAALVYFAILSCALLVRSRMGWILGSTLPACTVLLAIAGFWSLAQRDGSARFAIAFLLVGAIFATIRWNQSWRACKPLFQPPAPPAS